MRLFILVAVLVSILVTAQAAQATVWLDGARKGLMFELGLGPGGVHNELAVGTESEFALKTIVRIGYGFSNQFAMHLHWGTYYHNSVRDEILESALSGFRLTYFLAEEAPSTYVTGIIGEHSIGERDLSDELEPLTTGFGLGLGIGREFSKNWAVELAGYWGKPDSHSSADFGSNCYGIGLHLSHAFY